MWAFGGGGSADDDDLGDSRSSHFFEQPVDQSGAIAEPMRLTPPIAVVRKLNQRWIAGERRRQRRLNHVVGMIPSGA